MSTIHDIRLKRLVREHFTHVEAEQMLKLNLPLKDAKMQAARQERKDLWRSFRQEGLKKGEIRSRLNFVNKAESYLGKTGAAKRLEEAAKSPGYQPLVEKVMFSNQAQADFQRRYIILRKAGFFDFEARDLARMKNLSPAQRNELFRGPMFQKMIANHPKEIVHRFDDALRRINKDPRFSNRTEKEKKRVAVNMVRDMLLMHRMKKKFNPYDWLKKEYPRPAKPPSSYSRDNVSKSKQAAARHDNLVSAINHAKVPAGRFWD